MFNNGASLTLCVCDVTDVVLTSVLIFVSGLNPIGPVAISQQILFDLQQINLIKVLFT